MINIIKGIIITYATMFCNISAAEMYNQRNIPLLENFNLGKTTAKFTDTNIDDMLKKMPVDTKGINGRYPIGGESIAATHEIISAIKNMTLCDLNKDRLSRFIICVSSYLSLIEQNKVIKSSYQALDENKNVKCFLNSESHIEFRGYHNPSYIQINTNELMKSYHIIKSMAQNSIENLSKRKSLDCSWTNGIKIENVISMPIGMTRSYLKSTSDKYYISTVCVIDSYVNEGVLPACELQISGKIDDPAPNSDHGTHVAMTIKEISPLVKIISSKCGSVVCDKLTKASANPDVDVINLSNGVNPTVLSHMTEGTQYYKGIITALQNGKIVVKSLGNDQAEHDQQTIDNFIAKYNNFADKFNNDPSTKGLFIVVGNSTYKNKTDELCPASNRSYSGSNKYVITAPGTKITALVRKAKGDVEKDEYKEKSGTSMASPMVTGVISELLCEFTNKFIDCGIKDRSKIRRIVAENVLKHTRKTYLNSAVMLPNEFGQGILNYDGAKKGIETYLQMTEIAFAKANQITTIGELNQFINSDSITYIPGNGSEQFQLLLEILTTKKR